MTQAEIRAVVRRVQKDLYFGPDNFRVVLARMDERLGNMSASMDERLGSMSARIDERLRNTAIITDERLGNMSARIDERLGNMSASMDERLKSTSDSLDERLRYFAASMDQRFENMTASMDQRFSHTATREDIANLKISMARWFLGSILTLAGIIVTTFKWLAALDPDIASACVSVAVFMPVRWSDHNFS